MTVAGEQRGTETGRKGDVETISEGDVRPPDPGVGEQTSDLRYAERPGKQFVDALLDLVGVENAVDVPAAKDRPALGEEVVRDPGHGIVRQQPPKGTCAIRVDDQLYTGRCVDDDGSHTSPVLRNSARVSTARTGR